MILLPKSPAIFEDYEAGTLDIVAYETYLLQPLSGLSLDSVIDLRSRYLEGIRARLRPFMLERLAWHRREGHDLLLITAANAFLAEPITTHGRHSQSHLYGD